MPKFYLNAFPFSATVAEFKAGVTLSGLDPERYQQVLVGLAANAVVADEAGFEGICFSEQHNNIEGMPEVTTNPILLDTFVAHRTKRLRVGQLGMVLTSHHPLRVAEDIATLDHITGGRAFCGFSRGNARRWVNTFSQHYGTSATDSDKSEIDERNLRAVQEAWHIIKTAWTSDTFHHEGEFWTVPAPNTRWEYPPTRLYGKGMDAAGIVREIGCVPRPLQRPYPPVFTPLAYRMTTARFWVSQGATAVCYAGSDEFMKTAHTVLTGEAQKADTARRTPPLAAGAFLMVGKTAADAEAIRAEVDWLFEIGYSVPPFNVPIGRVLIGTPDDVSKQIEALLSIAPFEEIFLWHNIGLHDRRLEMNCLELFAKSVLPRFASTGR